MEIYLLIKKGNKIYSFMKIKNTYILSEVKKDIIDKVNLIICNGVCNQTYTKNYILNKDYEIIIQDVDYLDIETKKRIVKMLKKLTEYIREINIDDLEMIINSIEIKYKYEKENKTKI